MKNHERKCAITIASILLLFSVFFTARASFAQDKDVALVVTLKKSAVVSGERIKLSDIAGIDLSGDFSAARGDIENIEIGISPKPFLDRKITAGEVESAILKKIKLPGNAVISMTGAPACFVKYHEREDIKIFKTEVKKKLEEKIGELFRKDFGKKFGMADEDSLEVKLVSGLNDEIIKKIMATSEIVILISAYKAGMGTVSIKTGSAERKIPVKISKRSTLLKTVAKIKKGTAIAAEQLRTEFAVLPPEKFSEFIISAEEFLKEQGDNNAELIKDLLANEPLRKIYFKKKQLLNAGQKILLSVSNNNSIITFDAIAEGGGAIGDVISAVNVRTRKKYRAKITGNGTAEAF